MNDSKNVCTELGGSVDRSVVRNSVKINSRVTHVHISACDNNFTTSVQMEVESIMCSECCFSIL